MEDFFVKKHCQNMQLAGDKYFFIQPYSCQRYNDTLQFYSCLGDDGLPFPYPSLEFISTIGRVLCISNGLICFRNLSNDEKPLSIINPATKYWLEIPEPDGFDHRDRDLQVVFECNNVDGDYVLITVVGPSDWGSDPVCKLYSPREKNWKDGGRIKVGLGRNIRYETAMYHNGMIYLLSDSGRYFNEDSPFFWPYIATYDVENCITKFVNLPESSRKGLHDLDCKLGIFRWENSNICLVKLYMNVFSIWVLTNEEKHSWNRFFEMHVTAMGLWEFDLPVTGFTILSGKILLIATYSIVYRYDLSSGQVEAICGHQCRRDDVLFHSFFETLLPCGNGATKLAEGF